MEEMIDNRQKYANYTEQFQRLKKALSNGFNLEAMFIEYAIMEDRTESVLRHAELWESYLRSRKGRDPTINSKIRYIQKRAANKNEPLFHYFHDDLLEQILQWKDERNRLIHALLNQQFAHNEISRLAAQGDELVRALRTRSGACNRDMDKQKASRETTA